jgi:hypothetical protein
MTWQLTNTVLRYTTKLLVGTLGMALLALTSGLYLWVGNQDAKLLAAIFGSLAFAFYVIVVLILVRLRTEVRGDNNME